MEERNQKTIINDGITLPAHDFSGLSEVIEKAKPTLPGTENGFVPLSTLDVTKPYDTFAKYLENWEKRLHEDALQPEPIIEELKETKQKLVEQHEKDFEQRIKDRDTNYDARIEEWRTHCDERLKDWRNRFEPTEKENDDLRSRLEGELVAHHEALLRAQQDYHETLLRGQDHFHNEMKGELNRQIDELKTREKDLQERMDALLDERRAWLDKREEDFVAENRNEREFVNTLRKRVIENEHPLQDVEPNQTAMQILARKNSQGMILWGGGVVIVLIVAVTAIICCCLLRGGNQPVFIIPPTVEAKKETTPITGTLKIKPINISVTNAPEKNEQKTSKSLFEN